MLLTAGQFNTDKPQEYLDTYQDLFSSIREQELSILELGVFGGGSMELWYNYFPKARIVGLDINPVEVLKSMRVKFYQGDQKDVELLDRVTSENSRKGFDIIIDDASHFGKETFESFVYLFKNSLQPGGIYVIEDWGTGYWPHYPDGRNITLDDHHLSFHLHNPTDYKFRKKGLLFNNRRLRSHDFGMIGVVKQLIDEIAIGEATNDAFTNQKQRNLKPMISKIIVKTGQVVIYKA